MKKKQFSPMESSDLIFMFTKTNRNKSFQRIFDSSNWADPTLRVPTVILLFQYNYPLSSEKFVVKYHVNWIFFKLLKWTFSCCIFVISKLDIKILNELTNRTIFLICTIWAVVISVTFLYVRYAPCSITSKSVTV